jgi:hypothetical protein
MKKVAAGAIHAKGSLPADAVGANQDAARE